MDLNTRRVDVLLSDEEIAARRSNLQLPELKTNTPWEKIYRDHIGQLETGARFDFAVEFRDLYKVVPRHSH